MTVYTRKTWHNGAGGGTALDEVGFNDFEGRVETAVNSKADLVGGVVPTSQIPAIALGTAVPVANQAAMLALTSAQVQPGDLATRADGAGTFMLMSADPSQLANWLLLPSPTDAVVTVNGHTGTVVLGAADVGADATGAATAAQAAAVGSSAQRAANLSDLANAATARLNLGLDTAATFPQGGDILLPLSGAATATAAYLQLASAQDALIPQLGFGLTAPVLVDSEWMLATAYDTTNHRLYVTRGRRGTTAASHAATARALMPMATAAIHGVHAGLILDRAQSFNTDTSGVGSYAVHDSMALIIPPGVPFTVEYESQVGLYQNNAAQFAVPNIDVRIQNSAGTAVGVNAGIGDGSWRLRHIYPSTAGIEVVTFRATVDFDPLVASDIYTIYSRCSNLGTPTSCAARFGESSPQILTARAL